MKNIFASIKNQKSKIKNQNIFASIKNQKSKIINCFLIAITFSSLQAQNIPNDEPRFATDRVLVKLANTPAMRTMSINPEAAETPPELGVAISGLRLLNPSSGNTARITTFSTMRTNDTQNNVYVLMLEETGKEAVERALEILKANPAVEIAEPSYYYERLTLPNDPMFWQQYALGKINVLKAWEIAKGNKSVVVGVIDSGIDGTHPDLVDNLWVNPNPSPFMNDIHGYDFVYRRGGIPTEREGESAHGTHVAGIIGSKGNNKTGITGVNWDISLAWLGVGQNNSRYFPLEAIIEAINYATNHNIPITNNSYGSNTYSALQENAIRNYNGLFVAAAGNDRSNNDQSPRYPAGYNLPNIIAVAATDINDNLSSFSNYGRNSVHIAAPGTDILSTVRNGQYEEYDGTSMAAPHVAGAAALIMSVRPDLSPVEVREILIASSRRVNSLNTYGGFGILDVYAALKLALNDNLSSIIDLTVIDLSNANPLSAGAGWRFSDNVYTISGNSDITVTGDNGTSARRIEVMAGATANITLENTRIVTATSQSPLLLNSGANVTLTLVGENTLTAGSNRAGIQTTDATLIINGEGSLTVTGGNSGAGIGGGYYAAGGNITINSGTVRTTGGNGAAGIGGGYYAASGNIIINGGVVTANGGNNVPGIGGGNWWTSQGTFTINGNAIVFASSVGDTNINRRTGGILVTDNETHWYGADEIFVNGNAIIPNNYTLTISQNNTLTVSANATITNAGTVVNCGTINHGADYGAWAGNPYIVCKDFIIDMSVSNVLLPPGIGFTFANNIYTIADGAEVTVTGNNQGSQRRIEIETNAKNVKINLKDVTIGGLNNTSPILLRNDAEVTLVLAETNTLTAGNDVAGIQVPQGTTLTITGNGYLTANGGQYGAGIGGGSNSSGGDIIINGGVISAIGGNNAQGIGRGGSSWSGWSGVSGTFTMNGNAVVFSNSVGDDDESRRTGGILFIENKGTFYGENVTINTDVTIPANHTLLVPAGSVLTIENGATLTNNGWVAKSGDINHDVDNYGKWEGNPYFIPTNIINLTVSNHPPLGVGWTYANGVYTIHDVADVTVTGNNRITQNRIEIAANAKDVNLTLNNATISGLNDNQSPILLNTDAEISLNILGENNVTAAGWNNAGIRTSAGSSLTIDGAGVLTATGVNSGIGIGGTGGNITINGGVVTAAGITGTFAMNGNAVVFANSVNDTDVSRRTGGILFVGSNTANVAGIFYGEEVTITADVIIPSNRTLTVPAGATLNISAGATLTNNSVVINWGVINHDKAGYGAWQGNPYFVPQNVINLSETPSSTTGVGWTFANNVYTIQNGADVTIMGSNSANQRRIEVASDAKNVKIALANATISNPGANLSALLLNPGADVTLTLVGNNTLSAGTNCAGIQAPQGTALTITGKGSLTASGSTFGAGIGGGDGGNAGNIIINDGTVTATGGSSSAGIGGGRNGNGGNITISGGVVTANGSSVNGIGGGINAGNPGTLTMNGNAIVIANNSIGDTELSRRTSGILFIGNNGTFYGENVTITTDATIPWSRTLNVPTGATLTVPAGRTLTNNGTVTNSGTINIDGSYGIWAGNPPIHCNTINLSSVTPTTSGCGWTFANNVYTIASDANIIVTGNNGGSERRIEVEANAKNVNITLNDATITGLINQSPLLLNDGAEVNLIIAGTNNLAASGNYAGIQASQNTTLTIGGSGILFVDNSGTFYGSSVTINEDITFPENHTLTVPANATLNINEDKVLTNNGTVINWGTINHSQNNYGFWTGNPYIVPTNTINLSEIPYLTTGYGWSFANDVYTVENGADVVVTGSNEESQRRIEVAANADNVKITLKNATIDGLTSNQCPLLLNNSAIVTITLEGTNYLTAGSNRAGIQVPNEATLVIEGTGSLTATGGSSSAGIGGSGLGAACGTVTINAGTITATSGDYGAGIGGGWNGAGGNVTINGGVVTATGFGGAYVIGRGSGSATSGTLTMNNNPIVFASSVGDTDENKRTGGILVARNTTHWYGNDIFSISGNVNVPADYIFTVSASKTLNIPANVTLTNNGAVMNKGTIDINGKFTGNKILFENTGGNSDELFYNETAICIAHLFNIDKNAGTPAYTIETGSTGEGTLEGSNLTVTKSGMFIIGLVTAETDHYAAGAMVTSRITMNMTNFAINIEELLGGNITSNAATARANETITLTITPNMDYKLEAISIHKAGDVQTTVNLNGTGATRTFIMPNYDVTVAATFTVLNTNTSMTEILVNGQPATLRGNNVYHIVAECGADHKNIAVAIGLDATVRIRVNNELQNSQKSTNVSLYTYGENYVDFTVAAQNGSLESYKLIIDRKYDLIFYEFANLPTINNNPSENGGYIFSDFQWFRNGAEIYDANKPYYHVTSNAVYHAEMTLIDGSTLRTCDIRRSQTPANRLMAYPNPTQGRITLENIENEEQIIENAPIIQVFDFQGRLVLQTRENPLDMSGLPEGVYLIKVNDETVRVVVTR